MARFRLAGVLRARQLQEDAARGAVVRARTDSSEALAEVLRHERVLAATAPPTGAAAGAYIAALVARRSMAADLSALKAIAAQKAEVVDERLAGHTSASIKRCGVEKLGERHAAAAREAEDAAIQRELDDLSAGAHARRRPPVS